MYGCFLNVSTFNSVDSGTWVEDPVAEFEISISMFGYTIVGETTLVASGGYHYPGSGSPQFKNNIVLLQPNTGRNGLSTTLPNLGYRYCSIAINPTSKLGK